ncbi:Bacitracin transport ATP-binding protein BcrA (fragment) [groundwater metagenome]|uniref:Bacitracin transport ATP-binding protein BcrA n=1 Tax=groundwater metagenome TaxID=717931 RepID=A0A098EBX0_9ZZZZ
MENNTNEGLNDKGINNKETKETTNTTKNEVILECKNLTKDFDGFKALQNLNLTVYKGEIFAFIGANGAGKTTTMNILVGLIEPTEGDAIINGYSIVKNPIDVKRSIGFLPESVYLYSSLTARQNVRYIADLNGGVEEKKIDEVLDKVGLQSAKDRKAGTFSKGMRQRLGVACVLVKNPKVLFLDEPTSGLDPTGKTDIQNLLRNLSKEGMTIFYSSHILGEVEDIANRVGILHNGKLQKILEGKDIEKVAEIYKEITSIY